MQRDAASARSRARARSVQSLVPRRKRHNSYPCARRASPGAKLRLRPARITREYIRDDNCEFVACAPVVDESESANVSARIRAYVHPLSFFAPEFFPFSFYPSSVRLSKGYAPSRDKLSNERRRCVARRAAIREIYLAIPPRRDGHGL